MFLKTLRMFSYPEVEFTVSRKHVTYVFPRTTKGKNPISVSPELESGRERAPPCSLKQLPLSNPFSFANY